MSSTRNRPPAKGQAKQPDTGPRQPIFTPLNVGIVFGLLLIIAAIVYWKGFAEPKNQEIASLDGQINTQIQQNETYKRKAAKLDEARDIKDIMTQKIEEVRPKFLYDDDSIRTFFFETFPDILTRSNINPFTVKIETEWVYSLPWWFESPFWTFPDWTFPSDGWDLFTWKYMARSEGEQAPESLGSFGAPDVFIKPLKIHLEEVVLTYEGLQRFVENLQRRSNVLLTVHCFKNDSGENAGFLRTSSEYEIEITVYQMNPEKPASGDTPDGMPGSETC